MKDLERGSDQSRDDATPTGASRGAHRQETPRGPAGMPRSASSEGSRASAASPGPQDDTPSEPSRAISEVLNRLEDSLDGDEVTIGHVVDHLGRSSFASLMLVFSLISTSPASGIPGVTTAVAMLVLVLVVQMLMGRDSVWLPGWITRRDMDTDKLCKGIRWLRGPVRVVEKIMKKRLTFVFHRPWRWLPLSLILVLTLFMPFMEVIPFSGSIASAVIAFYAAGLLTRDGLLAIAAFAMLMVVPVTAYVWWPL